MKEGKKKGKRKQIRVWKESLNIPIYTVEWRGTERKGAGAAVSEAQVQASLMILL